MNKYVKDNKVITATEKAYNAIYKDQGYVLFEDDMEISVAPNAELEEANRKIEELENMLNAKNAKLEEDKNNIESLNSKVLELTDELSKLKDESENKKSKSKTKENQDNE